MTGFAHNNQLSDRIAVRFIVPTVLALLSSQAAILVQSVVVGRVVGRDGLAAMALCGSMSPAMMCIGAWIGVGGCVIGAGAIGAGNISKSNIAYTAAFSVSVVLGLALSLSGFVFAFPLAQTLGANDANIGYVTDYLRLYMLGAFFQITLYVPMNYLRLIGKPNSAMYMLLLMSAVNLGLSLLLVSITGMGITGAAIAGSAAYASAFAYGCFTLFRAAERPKLVRLDREAAAVMIKSIAALGSPAALNNFCMAAQIVCINHMLVRFGAADILPVFAVITAVSGVCFAFTIGIPQGALPLFGISYGERDFTTVRNVMRSLLLFGGVATTALLATIIALSTKIPALFGLENHTATTALFMYALSLDFAFMNNLAVNFFNATKRTRLANIMVFCRLIAFMLIPGFLLFYVGRSALFWLSYLISEVLTIIFVVVLLRVTKTPLLDHKLAAGILSADFSVAMTDEAIVEASENVKVFCKEAGIPAKLTMAVSLATEEILVLIKQYSLKNPESCADVRVTRTENGLFLRTRNDGKRFNAVEWYHLNKDSEPNGTMGIAMIVKLTQNVEYNNTFGINNLIVEV